MEERPIHAGKPVAAEKLYLHQVAKPAWQQQRTCDQCRFCDQDVDTFPCDRCHIRH